MSVCVDAELDIEREASSRKNTRLVMTTILEEELHHDGILRIRSCRRAGDKNASSSSSSSSSSSL